jgi:hypothetical protein
MNKKQSISEMIAKELQKIYGDKCKVIHIPMFYEEEVNKFIQEIEDAHRKAEYSKLPPFKIVKV